MHLRRLIDFGDPGTWTPGQVIGIIIGVVAIFIVIVLLMYCLCIGACVCCAKKGLEYADKRDKRKYKYKEKAQPVIHDEKNEKEMVDLRSEREIE
ncbi:MAG: uncharacterized protein KVP18_003923 [Porospora cf. gigantea A]|uniref:uncharacterized protein n=1 Tax=Porospora cf. gigantea A TaxID=2853593 RepID=UPI00355A27AB|nr:MAG: hypothetical protein KVP18_003923 [Porospora cf. gigantea A]